MIRFFKRLFGESESEEPVSISSIPAAPAPEKRSPTVQPRVTASPPPTATAEPCLEIPLRSVTERLPASLRSRMTRSAEDADRFHLPLSTVLEQLPRGAIKLPFSEVRQRATPGFFSLAHDVDDALVELPLSEVLARLPASHLRRRPEQKQHPVPQNIPAVFGSRADPSAPAAPAPSKPTSPVPAHAPAPLPTDQLSTSRILSEPVQPPSPVAPRPVSIAPPRGVHPVASAAAPRAEWSPPAVAVRPAAPQVPTPANTPTVSAESQEPVKVSLVQLARNWPDQLRREVMSTHLAASINIPFADLEAAMKRGKAQFSWKQLRLWMGPKPSTSLMEHDSLSLELPLSILTPLFLARRSDERQAKKTATAPELPDIFTSRKTSGPGPESTSHAPNAPIAMHSSPTPVEKVHAPEPAHPVADRVRPGPLLASQPDRLTMARSSALPTQLVQRACQLSGVAGALVATSDGLVIASQLAPGMSAEAIAAFLPEMYSRLGQYTRELKLGDPSHIELLAGNIPLQIFKTHNAFYAVFGKSAEPLPKLQLTALAAQLSQQPH